MFVSHGDGQTTSTIKVNVGQDLFWSVTFFLAGLLLVAISLRDGPIEHYGKLLGGILLLWLGYSLGQATMRLIWRAQRAYYEATGPSK